MDPVACIERLKTAVKDQDIEEVNSSFNDLWEWLDKGGFAPALIGPIFGFYKVEYMKSPVPFKCIFNGWRSLAIMIQDSVVGDCPDQFTWKIVKYTMFGEFVKEYKFPTP